MHLPLAKFLGSKSKTDNENASKRAPIKAKMNKWRKKLTENGA